MSDLKVKRVILYLLTARDLIETGKPWYQPQPYALAAIKDCDDAVAALQEQGLNNFTVELAMMTISAASQCTRRDREEEILLSYVTDIGRRWRKEEAQA
ncbi:hypothetical protein [Agrobacterium sp. NPDC089420]|uniref:hypothetical protein n=1 Tax=Agrobacterium sp. NPDC089420 TaxID=3363918 RepID=UPI00384D3A43